MTDERKLNQEDTKVSRLEETIKYLADAVERLADCQEVNGKNRARLINEARASAHTAIKMLT